MWWTVGFAIINYVLSKLHGKSVIDGYCGFKGDTGFETSVHQLYGRSNG